MDKVKLPHEVAQAIESLLADGWNNERIMIAALNTDGIAITERMRVLKSYAKESSDELMRALVNGYEAEETPEDKVRAMYELWDNWEHKDGHFSSHSIANIIVDVVNALGHKIKGVND